MAKKSSSHVNQRFQALQQVAVELIHAHNQRDLLSLIVNKAVDLMVCDGGSLYLKHDAQNLIFEIAVNRSTKINYERKLIPIESDTLASYVFRTRKPLRIKDVQKLPRELPYHFDHSLDDRLGYRTYSVLSQPLYSSKGERLGVIQLINRKKTARSLWPSHSFAQIRKMPGFDVDDEKLLRSFASIASAAIENAQLYKNIEGLFEGLVHASVEAIEKRDGPTRGHSERVAILTVELARKVSQCQDVEVRNIRYSKTQIAEIRYAALLHDFGKIGVRESILLKEEKLAPEKKSAIFWKLQDFRMSAEIRFLRELLLKLQETEKHPTDLDFAYIERQIREFGRTLDDYWRSILDLNKPTIVLTDDRSNALRKLQSVEHVCHHGQPEFLLGEDDVQSLAIKKGSLTTDERLEIQDHVTVTYNFLRKIPWTADLSKVPEIAYGHHEYLDGTGYPRKITANDIPNQARMMTICDIYDALVASDRPYKPAVPMEKALDILQQECSNGKLDARFLKVFIEARLFELPEFLALSEIKLKKTG